MGFRAEGLGLRIVELKSTSMCDVLLASCFYQAHGEALGVRLRWKGLRTCGLKRLSPDPLSKVRLQRKATCTRAPARRRVETANRARGLRCGRSGIGGGDTA